MTSGPDGIVDETSTALAPARDNDASSLGHAFQVHASDRVGPEDVDLLSSLPEILTDLWNRLSAGVSSGKHPFHLGTLATLDHEGQPSQRMMVLRHADAHQRSLRCHTDRRSPKVDHLVANPRCCWLFYDPVDKIQLRLFGPMVVHTNDDLAEQRWHATALRSRRCYLAPDGPGTQVEHPSANLPKPLIDRNPTQEESEAGRDRFTVLETSVEAIDWLHLRGRGHRRAQFRWCRSGQMEAHWVAP